MRITTILLSCVLAIIAGSSVVLAAHWYTQLERATQQQALMGPFTRLVVIEDYDASSRMLTVITPTRHIAASERARMQVTQDARIEIQTAKREGDVVVGYHPLETASVEQLQPGSAAFVSVRIRPDGILETAHMVVTDTLIRP